MTQESESLFHILFPDSTIPKLGHHPLTPIQESEFRIFYREKSPDLSLSLFQKLGSSLRMDPEETQSCLRLTLQRALLFFILYPFLYHIHYYPTIMITLFCLFYKWMIDQPLNNKLIGKKIGLDLALFNRLESEMFFLLDHILFIDYKESMTL